PQARSKPSGTVPVLDKPHSGNNQTWNESLAMVQAPYRPPSVPAHNHHQWSSYPLTGNPYGPTTPTIHHTWIQNNYSYHYPPSVPVQLPATSTAVVPQRVGSKLLFTSGGSPKKVSASRKYRTMGYADLVSHVQLYADRKRESMGEVAASNHERKKSFPPWKQQEEKGKFKAPPPMTTPVEKQNHTKFYEFHGEVWHNTDECMHQKKQIEEMLKARTLSHLIKELKQNSGKEQPKAVKKGETSWKDKALDILMVQPWERVARKKIRQSFSPNTEIIFPPLDDEEGTEGSMIIEAEIGGHCIHSMYVDGGSALEILYEYCFNRLRPEIKNQLVPATTALIGFSGEIILPIGKIQLPVRIGDEKHSASALMNFMVVRSPSPYNGIIRRPGVRKLQAVPSTAHEMLKLPVEGGVIILKAVGWSRWNTRWATYQLLVDKAFHKQIGRNLEVYVDDLVIKSRTEDEIVRDIEETFKTLREINMKLNPKKYTFGVEEGMFLGYKISTNGLKVCPDKKSDFHWTTEAEEAFKQMKQLIAELHMLTAPTKNKELIVYFAAAKETVSAVLMTEREAKRMPIYFVSRALRGPKIKYTSMEKLHSRTTRRGLSDGSGRRTPQTMDFVHGRILCTDGSGAGLILINPEGMEFTYALRFRFEAINNEAEYEALITGLRIAEQMGVKISRKMSTHD
nr:reverse transcriptase domain-containing protein [Tanacetum cinerariifolium]